MNDQTYAMSWHEAVESLRQDAAQQELVRACFYDDPLISSAKRYWSSSEWAAVRAMLPQGRGRVLDIGAGRGISSYALARDGWCVTALEPDPSLLVGAGAIRSLSAESGLDIQVISQWGEQLPFEAERFDAVYCRAVLHHSQDLDALCNEVARILKPNGVFMATREHVVSGPEDLPRFYSAHPLHHLYGGEHAYTVRRYLSAIRAAGLEVERVINPYASDLNLFPDTRAQLRRRFAARLHIPSVVIPNLMLTLAGMFVRVPGRLYSFCARRRLG